MLDNDDTSGWPGWCNARKTVPTAACHPVCMGTMSGYTQLAMMKPSDLYNACIQTGGNYHTTIEAALIKAMSMLNTYQGCDHGM